MSETDRTVPDYLEKSVIYQIFLCMFTPEGTLNSAVKMLPHLTELGVGIIYLCLATGIDDDMRTKFLFDLFRKQSPCFTDIFPPTRPLFQCHGGFCETHIFSSRNQFFTDFHSIKSFVFSV